jgi:hypothetical protein
MMVLANPEILMFRFHRRKLCQAAGLSLCLGAPMVVSAATLAEAPPTPPPPPKSPSTHTVLAPARSLAEAPTHDQLLKMGPEEREARLKALRERKVLPLKGALTPAEREQRRLEIRQRLEKRLEGLRKRKKERALTAEEEKQLRRLEEVARGFQTPRKPKPDTGADSSPSPEKK